LALALAFKAGAAPARRLKSGLKKCIPHFGLAGRRRQIESLYALIQSLNEARPKRLQPTQPWQQKNFCRFLNPVAPALRIHQ